MEKNEAEKIVLNILTDICDDEIVKEEPDIDLLEEGLIDSLDYVDMLVRFEDSFGIVMSPSELARDEMNTPAKIVAQVLKRIGQ